MGTIARTTPNNGNSLLRLTARLPDIRKHRDCLEVSVDLNEAGRRVNRLLAKKKSTPERP
jgi:hypothetical protein